MSKRIYNLHQQKAGGKTVESALERVLGNQVARVSKLFPETAVGDISLYKKNMIENPEIIPSSVRVVTGHFYYGLHETSEEEYTYTTIIREPISRLKSYYNYVMNGDDDYFLKVFFQQNEIDFDRFIHLGDTFFPENCPSDLTIVSDNGQSRLLHGTPVTLGHHMQESEYLKVIENLEAAFSIVAPVTRVSEFTVSLFGLLGRRPPAFLPRVNVQEKDWVGEIPEKLISYAQERHEFDRRLYKYAHKRFEERGDNLKTKFTSNLISMSGSFYNSLRKLRGK